MSRKTVLLILTLTATVLSTVHPTRAAANEAGFFATLGLGGVHLDLHDTARSSLSEAGVTVGTTGLGADILAGYRFGRHISLGLRVTGSELDTGLPGVDGTFGMFTLEVTGYLRPGSEVQPYLVGGTGGAGLGLDGGGFDNVVLDASAMHVGGGVDVNFATHWTLSFDYRASMLDFERNTIELARGPDVEFDGSALAHLLGFRWSYRF